MLQGKRNSLYQKGTSLTNGGKLWICLIPKVGASTTVSPKSSVQCRTLQLTMHRWQVLHHTQFPHWGSHFSKGCWDLRCAYQNTWPLEEQCIPALCLNPQQQLAKLSKQLVSALYSATSHKLPKLQLRLRSEWRVIPPNNHWKSCCLDFFQRFKKKFVAFW